jgi:hypothetical protein
VAVVAAVLTVALVVLDSMFDVRVSGAIGAAVGLLVACSFAQRQPRSPVDMVFIFVGGALMAWSLVEIWQ